MNEADTCRKFVVPKLQEAGWDDRPHAINEQRTFTDGRVVFVGGKARRGKQKRSDYLLRYNPDFPIAVVEAKSRYRHAAEGLQQAKEYAEILGLRFAYSTNGIEIVEFDYTTGIERTISDFPAPDDLWARLRRAEGIVDDQVAERLLTPTFPDRAKPLRYYQEIAVNRAVQAALQGRTRALLTLCTGAGKTAVAFQICWKLWSARWNSKGVNRNPKILFLADRNVLVDDPMAKDFSPFGDARHKIAGGVAVKSRDMYFAIYQSIARDENRPGLYREYARDFFDLIIIDECHRGSARDDSNWREILEWFEPATQIGMTATPRREDNVDTYNYFGDPLYEYSLAQGIADGFLAPYRVHRVISDYDAAGWRPTRGELDRYGREIPDAEYSTRDFERVVALRARTQAIARHLAGFMAETDRFAKTIVFCVDQEHALEMRQALAALNTDLVKDHPDYVCRVTSDEGDVGSAHRAKFQDVETQTPVILTTSQLLTTGVDAPTCKNVVLARVVGSMPEFKQIIGRGTRLRPDYGKLAFNIIDYTGTATRMFADPAFDGDPVREDEAVINADGDIVEEREIEEVALDPDDFPEGPDMPDGPVDLGDEGENGPRKFYVDGGEVSIVRHLVYELDSDGRQLACRQLTDYTGDKVRTLYPSNRAGAPWIDVMRPSGRDFPLQPHFGVNRIANWSPSTNTAINTEGLPITSVGTVSTPALAATSLATSMRRWRLTSAAVVDSVADQRSAGWACWRGNAAGLGGWTFVTRLSLTTLQATGMGFFGLYGSTAALAITLTLATVVNCIGIGFQRGTHANWQLVANDATGAPTLTDMGAAFAVATGGVLTLFIAAAPNAASVWVRLVNEVTGAVFEQEIAADLPAATQFLSPRLYLNNGATAAAVAYDCSGVYVETDF